MNSTSDKLGTAGPEFEQRMAQIQQEHTQRMAEMRIARICQNGSINTYVEEFLDLARILQWNDSALMFCFERGLKEDVEEILCLKDRPDTLSCLIEEATKIDNRIQERKYLLNASPRR